MLKTEDRIEIFRERLFYLIESRQIATGKTKAKQAEEMGTSKANLTKYFKSNNDDKKLAIPRIDQLIRIADYYNVSTDYLLGHTDAKHTIDTEEGRIRTYDDAIGFLRKMGEESKAICDLSSSLSEKLAKQM